MELAVSLLAEIALMAALGLDLRRLRRRGDRPGSLEPFRIWVLRVYFFSVLALPFYFWRTRGKARWALVGVLSGILYVLVLNGALILMAPGCSATSPDAQAPDPRAEAGAEAGPSHRAADGGAATGTASASEREVAARVRRLSGAAFPEVLAARTALLTDASPRTVAALVALAASTERVPLTDTADLVYPGTRRFHGHGLVVPYDLDRLGARAGWLLEELTLQDFGFSRAAHPDAAEPAEHPDAAARAAAWWGRQGGRFSRVGALTAALRTPASMRAPAVLGLVGQAPLDPAVRAALGREVVPALTAGLSAAEGPARGVLCRVARLLVLRELSRDDARVARVLERPLAGDANLVAALGTTLAPELTLQVDVPGAAEILAPAFAVRARDALEELLRRLAYARGDDQVGVVLQPGHVIVYAGDPSREAEAWRAWLGSPPR